MTSRLDRLAALQRELGDALRAPLDRVDGALRAVPARYGAALCARLTGGEAARDRLAAYNRLYWLRLCSALRDEYRLTTALLGGATFDDLATQFLLARPPGGRDLAAIGDGLARFVDAAVAERGIEVAAGRWVPRIALADAIQIDVAFQRAFAMGPPPPLRLTDEDAATFGTARLVPSRGVALVDEQWPLVQIRWRLRRDSAFHVALPAPHRARRTWAIAGKARGVRALPLIPLHARLLRELAVQPVDAALAALTAACPPGELAALEANARAWLAQSVELGMWSAIEHAPA